MNDKYYKKYLKYKNKYFRLIYHNDSLKTIKGGMDIFTKGLEAAADVIPGFKQTGPGITVVSKGSPDKQFSLEKIIEFYNDKDCNGDLLNDDKTKIVKFKTWIKEIPVYNNWQNAIMTKTELLAGQNKLKYARKNSDNSGYCLRENFLIDYLLTKLSEIYIDREKKEDIENIILLFNNHKLLKKFKERKMHNDIFKKFTSRLSINDNKVGAVLIKVQGYLNKLIQIQTDILAATKVEEIDKVLTDIAEIQKTEEVKELVQNEGLAMDLMIANEKRFRFKKEEEEKAKKEEAKAKKEEAKAKKEEAKAKKEEAEAKKEEEALKAKAKKEEEALKAKAKKEEEEAEKKANEEKNKWIYEYSKNKIKDEIEKIIEKTEKLDSIQAVLKEEKTKRPKRPLLLIQFENLKKTKDGEDLYDEMKTDKRVKIGFFITTTDKIDSSILSDNQKTEEYWIKLYKEKKKYAEDYLWWREVFLENIRS